MDQGIRKARPWYKIIDSKIHTNRRAIELKSDARVLKLLGGALYARKEYSAAHAVLQEALRLQPAYPDALCDLGALSPACKWPHGTENL